MINPASKVFFALSGVAAAFGLVYGIVISTDRLGTSLALAVLVGALVVGLALAVHIGPELRPGGALVEAADRGEPVRASVWPAVAAFFVTGALFGGTVNGWLFVLGAVLALCAFIGWLGQAWSEDRSWDQRLGERFAERVVRPVLMPVGAGLIVAVIAVSMSRVLLAVDANAAVAIACVVAAVVFVVLTYLSAATQLNSGILKALGIASLAATMLAGALGANAGAREPEHKPHDEAHHQEVAAFGTNFVSKEDREKILRSLTVKAEDSNEIVFLNFDEAIFHNIGIYKRTSPTPITQLDVENDKALWNGKPVEGSIAGVRVDYRLPELESGSYLFRCDFHPNMVGSLKVE